MQLLFNSRVITCLENLEMLELTKSQENVRRKSCQKSFYYNHHVSGYTSV